MFIGHWSGRSSPVSEDETRAKAFVKIQKATHTEYNTQIDRCFWNTHIKNKQELDDNKITKIAPIFKCRDCLAKDSRFIKEKRKVGSYGWNKNLTREYYISKEIENIEDWEDFFSYNLIPAEVKEGDIIKS